MIKTTNISKGNVTFNVELIDSIFNNLITNLGAIFNFELIYSTVFFKNCRPIVENNKTRIVPIYIPQLI